MMALLIGMEHLRWLEGGGARSTEFPDLTYRQVTIFFSVFVFFQVWNQINCRSLSPRESGLQGLFANPTFLAIKSKVLISAPVYATFPPSPMVGSLTT